MDPARYRASEDDLWRSVGVEPSDRAERRLGLARTGTSVRVQVVGEGPSILFVHGGNTSGISWAALAARIVGFRRILLDRPGTGLSDPLPRPLDRRSLPAFGDGLIVDVLDALELPDAHVAATSFGGYIALRSAAAHPGRVRRMVLYSWPVGAVSGWVPWSMRIMTVPGAARLLARLPQSEDSVRRIFRQIGHEASLADGRITAQDIATYLGVLRHTDTLRNEMAFARAFVSPLRGLNDLALPDEVLGSIDAPVRLLWGERDPFGGVASARALAARIPGADLEVIPGAGHAPWLDALEHVAAATSDWFGR